MCLALELLAAKSPMCLNGPRSGSALEEGFGCEANVDEETAVQLSAAATFSRGTPRAGKAGEGGSIFAQMPDSGLSTAHSVHRLWLRSGEEGRRGRVGGREEQRDLWWVTPTSSCLSSSRTKGRVLFLTLMGAGDNNVLGFHRLAVGSHILGLRVLVLDSHKTSSASFPRPTLRLSPSRPGHMLETSRLPRGVWPGSRAESPEPQTGHHEPGCQPPSDTQSRAQGGRAAPFQSQSQFPEERSFQKGNNNL